jgi:hypothetical protein
MKRKHLTETNEEQEVRVVVSILVPRFEKLSKWLIGTHIPLVIVLFKNEITHFFFNVVAFFFRTATQFLEHRPGKVAWNLTIL